MKGSHVGVVRAASRSEPVGPKTSTMRIMPKLRQSLIVAVLIMHQGATCEAFLIFSAMYVYGAVCTDPCKDQTLKTHEDQQSVHHESLMPMLNAVGVRKVELSRSQSLTCRQERGRCYKGLPGHDRLPATDV